MTAETLKPFITPQNAADNFPAVQSSASTKHQYHRKLYLLALGISVITLVLLALFSGYTIWLSKRVSDSETEVIRLNRVIESLQKHLGIHYLEEMQEFEKAYQNAIIDDPSTLDYIESDYDDDDDDDESDENDKSTSKQKLSKEVDTSEDDINYDQQIEEYLKKFNNYDDDDDIDDDEETVTSDSLYNDFEKYKDSKSKDESSIRVTRSIANVPQEAKNGARFNRTKQAENLEVEVIDSASTTKRPLLNMRRGSKDAENIPRRPGSFVRDENLESRPRTPLRLKSQRRHRYPLKKSGESLLSAKYTTQVNPISNVASNSAIKPAAHFHLYQKLPHHQANTREDGYRGDVYIAHHPSWSNEVLSEHYFTVKQDILTVREPGLYYVYAQVCYNNTYDENGFIIFHNHKPFLQCLNTVPTNRQKLHTCHTSGLVYLRENEPIHIRDFHNDRNAVLKNSNNRSYFGLMKV